MNQDMRDATLRPQLVKELQETTYDLLVIGGGVTGCGIALDAASRGMRVALVEKNDFASGTSSKSTKLIHGGLRYLKQFEIGLVRETGLERAVVHKLAPHLVRPRKMLLPLIKGGSFGRLSTSIGLRVYDFLADVEKEDRRVMLSRKETIQREPLLRTDGLLGGGYYAEYQTDDARLTVELAMTAVQKGAHCLNYCLAREFTYDDGRVNGIRAVDTLNETEFTISARYVVSAAGPWVDQLRRKDQSLEGKRLFLSKGVHLVFPREKLPLQQAVYFDVPDGRMIFAIPRLRATYVGTTDTAFEGTPDQVGVEPEDVQYLLSATNNMFPDLNLTAADVESTWAGLRPLIYEPGKKASEMSRKDEIFESEQGLISIAGGKLTGYRKMAERIVDLVADKYSREVDRTFGKCKTRELPLVGGPFTGAKEVQSFEENLLTDVKKRKLPVMRAAYLVSNYGRKATEILANMDEFTDDVPEVALARAELRYCVERELCRRPLDFFNRRTGRLYFDIVSIPDVAPAVLADFQAYFNWSEETYRKELNNLQEEIRLHSEFKTA